MTNTTRQERIARIREACVRANPEIMRLKYGCRVLLGKTKKANVTHVDYEKSIYTDKYPDTQFEKYEYKIIGRPVRLFDVAKVVREKHGLIDRWKGTDDINDQTDEDIQWVVDQLQ